MIGRLRQVLPGRLLVPLALLFIFFEGPVLYLEWRIGRPLLELKVRPGTVLIYLTAAFYGIYRAMAFHPFYQEDYRQWLELTPWTVHKPLPMGPISLILEDGVLLSVLILISLTQPYHYSIRIVNIFLISHSVFLAATFWSTGTRYFGYLAVFGVDLAILLWPSPWICFAVTVSIYLVVYEGLWQSLARFPWPIEWSLNDLLNTQGLTEKLVGPACGWPYDRFFRDIRTSEKYTMAPVDAILLSLVAGWSAYCIFSLVQDPDARLGMGSVLAAFVSYFVWLSRLVTYTNFYRPPISLWGRIWTGKWVIPGYDICLVGPAFAIVGGVLMYAMSPRELRAAVAMTTVILLILLVPPELRKWRLTGKHRIIASRYGQGKNADFVKVP